MYSTLKNQFTKRDLKRKTKDNFDQNLQKLFRKEKELNEKWINLPLIELKKPYQRGFNRFFVLRNDVSRSPQSDFFQNLLDKINSKQWHFDKKFKIKKRKNRKKLFVDRIQLIENISIYDFLKNPKINWTDKERKYFELKEIYNRNSNSYIQEYVFTEPWRFVLKVVPNIVTHSKQRDEELDLEMGELRLHIENRNLMHKIRQLKSKKSLYKGYGISNWELKEKLWFKKRNKINFIKDNN